MTATPRPSRMLALFLPTLATDRIRRLRGISTNVAPDAPLASIAKVKSALRLVAVDLAAAQAGLSPGMALADARAMHPGLDTAEANPQAEAALLADIAAWCRRYTPLCAPDAPDGVFLDISGAAHLFGGEAALITDLEARLKSQGFASRAAIAATPEAAFALARYAAQTIAPQDLDARAAARLYHPLPLAALRLPSGTLAGLAQAGLRRVGDIALRPRAPVAARYGPALFARLDALLGHARSAISPQFAAPAYVAERRFASAITQDRDIEGTILALAHELARMLARHGEGARRLCLTLFRMDGAVRDVFVGASRPLADAAAIARLFRERFKAAGDAGIEADAGFETLRLAALEAEPLGARQAELACDSPPSQGGAEYHDADLAQLIDRLGARLGIRRVMRLVAEDTHMPEFAVSGVPAASAPARRGGASFAAPQPGAPTRPLRLLARPEPIETMASVPDGPPLRFRWRRMLHEVAAIEGPERIAPQWWSQEASALTRDYFRAQDTQGRHFWLYREGLYAREAGLPKWWMHGLFG